MSLIKRSLLVLILVGLSACQWVADDQSNKAYQQISLVTLNQTLTVEPGTARAYIQYGEAKTFNDVNIRMPWCQFYRFTTREELTRSHSIAPDTFEVTDAQELMEVVQLNTSPIQRASYQQGHSAKVLLTRFTLKSAKQPRVTELRCGVFADPSQYDFISMDQLEIALGDVATLVF